MSPTFSIIIPVFNVAPYLRECLDSVLAQTYTDWEAICVDDGSTDGSGKILDEYAAKDPRFKVIHQANAGVSVARNAALDVAQGEWVWFVDADDFVREDALQFFRTKIDQNSGLELLALKDFIRAEALAEWPELIENGEWWTHGAKEYLAFHNGACNVVFRLSFLDGLRIEHFAIGEDVLFFAILFWRAKHLLVVDVPLYFYRQRPTGASMGNVSIGAARDNLEIERRCLELIKQHKDEWCTEDFKQYFAAHSRYLMVTNMNKFMRISDEDRAQILPLWLKVQQLALDLGERMRYLQTTVILLSIIPSGRLARLCVDWIVDRHRYRARCKRVLRIMLYPLVVATRSWRHPK